MKLAKSLGRLEATDASNYKPLARVVDFASARNDAAPTGVGFIAIGAKAFSHN
jgi:hypothetical protein